MPATSPAPARNAAWPKEALNLVLFGLPNAGKSSLLGALAQSARTQEHLLNGHLTDVAHGLNDLNKRVYDEGSRETLDEVVPYPVKFESFATASREQETYDAVIVDCDGRVANDLLARRRSLDVRSKERTLEEAIERADALVLAVDVSSSAAQIDADFEEFGRFLRNMERMRGLRNDVSGLPVYLVLTKCDLLAEPQDPPSAWLDKIEQRKRAIGGRFRKFFEREDDDAAAVPFGKIDLNVWATSVKRPELAGHPAKPREPQGVAELFRQCIEAAQEYRDRRQRSGRRLLWTVSGSSAVVAALSLMAGIMVANRPQEQTSGLSSDIAIYKSGEGQTPSERLREPLQRKISKLTEFKGHPDFESLPQKEQDFVRDRLQELQQYKVFQDKLQQQRPVASARAERDLREMEDTLREQLAIPEGYRREWSQTDAVLLRDRREDDLRAVRKAVNEAVEWYRQRKREGDKLWSFSGRAFGSEAPASWRAWLGDVDRLLADSETDRFREADKIPGSQSITWANVNAFEQVQQAHADWSQVRQRLSRLRNICLALGLAGSNPAFAAALDIPSGCTLDQARVRKADMDRAYRGWQKDFPAGTLPDAVDPEIRAAARASFEKILPAGREFVLRKLLAADADKESADAWAKATEAIGDAPDLADWNALASALLSIQSSDAKDPVSTLLAFLKQKRFDLEMRRLTLEIPNNLAVRPEGALTVSYQAHAAKEPTRYLFRLQDDKGQRDTQREVTTYTFVADSNVTIAFEPGDDLWADVPLKKEGAKEDWQFTWSVCRSQMFRFERLSRTPRLHLKTQKNTEGSTANGVVLRETQAHGVPAVPDLLPVVKPK